MTRPLVVKLGADGFLIEQITLLRHVIKVLLQKPTKNLFSLRASAIQHALKGHNMISRVQEPRFFGLQCGVNNSRDYRVPEAMNSAKAEDCTEGEWEKLLFSF